MKTISTPARVIAFLGALLLAGCAAPPATAPRAGLDRIQHIVVIYALSGDTHIANLVAKIKASPLWTSTVIIVTYDENGGFWDHAAPPKGDRWGPGSRIPAIVVSPFAKKSYVDHTPYDTTSIIKFITLRFGLEPLPGVRAEVGDLTAALDLAR